MASHAKLPALKNQAPVLAQAKPAIISAPSSNYYDTSTGALSEKLNTVLKFSPTVQEREIAKFNYDHKIRHIEDDNVIQKQNASNQMRQAAVQAAAASQQKVRLSATERLAMTAKRPMTNQQIQTKQPLVSSCTNSLNNSKLAPLPTLETLLAVQRQLQQHTKQHLNPVPQLVVSNSKQEQHATATSVTQRNKPLPPSPPRSPALSQQQTNHITHADTYEKDLPPLPSSISPSTSTDDSQMNSLESHQSSPATSLVSIPPPPPPISSYLEQYDEVNCHQVNRSNISSPSAASSASEVSSVRHFPSAQVKVSNNGAYNNTHGFDLPHPLYMNNSNNHCRTQPPNVKAGPIKPAEQEYFQAQTTNLYNHSQQSSRLSISSNSTTCSSNNQSTLHHSQNIVQKIPTQQPSQQIAPIPPVPKQSISNLSYDQPAYNSQISYQKHMFTMQTSNSQQAFMPPPPPPLLTTPSLVNDVSSDGGFDQPDSGSFRFPTPPPPDLLLDDEDDEDFQCNIPTPPLNKSMSMASFPDPHCQQQQQRKQQKHTSSQMFNSSTFSPTSVAALQPPPLFRQQPVSQTPPQLTVHINNDAGLLSTADSNHSSVNHHHHIMMTMTASSSSPSSSSDGDGQSSNSSSSTSGIHSSIDSPSSSNSKLDDFNYSCKQLKKPDSVASESYLKGITPIQPIPTVTTTTATRRPALKQKKTVSFSDKVELVACAGEHSDDHLPNPLLARVLAGKLQ